MAKVKTMSNLGDLGRRVFVLSLCVLFLGMISYSIIVAIRNKEKIPITALFFFAFVLWLNVLAFRRILANPHKRLDAWMAGISLSPHAVTATFDNFFQPASVTFDPETSRLYFVNCHAPRRFLAMSEGMYSCSIQDVCALYAPMSSRDTCATIVTIRGKAMLPWRDPNCCVIYELLQREVPKKKPGYTADNPILGMAYVGLAIVGLAFGVLATPRNADVDIVALFMIVGAFIGVFSVQLLIIAMDRTTKADMAAPIGHSMKFALASLPLGGMFSSLVGWEWQPMIAFALAGAMIGFFHGMAKRQ